MNYNDAMSRLQIGLNAFLGANVNISDFSFDELLFSKRVKTPAGFVVKKIKRTTFFFAVKGLKNNEVVNDPNFIYEIKGKLEDTFNFKFKRIIVRYPEPGVIEVEA